MSTNRGDELLSVLRTRLTGVSSLPAARAWQNQRFEPTPGVDFIEDAMLTMDTQRREVGVNAYGRTTALYRVIVHTASGAGAMPALAIAAAITDAIAATATLMTVGGLAVTVEHIRSGPTLEATQSSQWFSVPIYISLSFDHA